MDYRNIQKPVRPLLDQSDAILHQCLESRIALINTLHRSTPTSEGKKIRTTFFLLLSGLHGVSSRDLARIATAIELFHLSSLIHDDIIDNSHFRRGKKTARSAFGNHLSVLWGDHLFISAFNILREIGNQWIINCLIEAAQCMIEGQILEYENNYNYHVRVDTYLEIIAKKTASLFGTIGQVVHILSRGKPQCRNDLVRFGEDFGMIFQISDDLLDIVSLTSGKDPFRDLLEGKITLPYILFLEKNEGELSKRKVIRDLERFREKIRLSGAIEKTREHLDLYIARCQSFLNRFPDSLYKKKLLDLLLFVVERDY